MTCGGCSGAVERALKKVDGRHGRRELRWWLTMWLGITYLNVSLEEQKVVVEGDVPYETVLEKIKKTNKEVGVAAAWMLPLH